MDFFKKLGTLLNPFAPGDFAEKRVLKLVERFSGHCRAIIKELKPVYRSYTSRPSDPDAKYQLAKFGHGFKSDTAVLTFTFRFLSSLLFAFLASFFFSLAGHLVGFILVRIVFRKAFRILGLGEKKGRWAMEQDFHGDFQFNVTWFFASFSGVLD